MSKIRLSEAMESFADSLKAQGKAERTIKNNLQPLNKALELWGNIYLDSIQPRHIDLLFSEYDWSPATHNLYLSNLRANFFTWARRHRYVHKDFDPTEGWRNRRVPQTTKLWIPIERFPELLGRAKNERDRALIAIGLFTFARGGEICTLRVKDVNFDTNTIYIYRRKTQQEDTMPMASELRTELLTWFNTYKTVQGRLDPEWFVIPHLDRGRLQRHENGYYLPADRVAGVTPEVMITRPYYRIKPVLVEMGYDDHGTGTHTMRRSGARALFDKLRSEGFDGSLLRVQSMLGHADPETTMKYIGVTLEKQQRNEMLAGKPMFPDIFNDAQILKIAR